MNDENHINLRRYRKNIKIYGLMVIAYGVWGVLKVVLLSLFGGDQIKLVTPDIEASLGEYANLVVALFFIAVVAIVLGVNLAIGIGAFKFAKGKKKKIGFVVVAIIYLIIVILSMSSYFIGDNYAGDNLLSMIAAMLVDVCTCFALIDMVISAIKVNNILKVLEQEN